MRVLINSVINYVSVEIFYCDFQSPGLRSCESHKPNTGKSFPTYSTRSSFFHVATSPDASLRRAASVAAFGQSLAGERFIAIAVEATRRLLVLQLPFPSRLFCRSTSTHLALRLLALDNFVANDICQTAPTAFCQA
ncbi:hypothetical protein Tcan_00371 [Toxocara canis]|uniref:Uncharacterized protein n=1 Tax=Toxocara canis TaxID=6265 RepID=A0A0B2UZD8_TOXCA|nr:hypothetical protein Tcan_00371 [Toxocara canis]